MVCSKLYKKWIKYLSYQKLYTNWMLDVKSFVEYNSWYNIGFITPKNPFSDTFIECEDITTFKFCITNLTIVKHLLNPRWHKLSDTNWNKIFLDFKKKTNSEILSKTLSRKISRANSKKRERNYREKVDQPWYDKSYEKNKYSKKSWKK